MLTKDEAIDHFHDLPDMLYALGDLLDDLLTRSNRQAETAEIWSTLDAEDTEKIGKLAIRAGKRSELAAKVVRRAMEIGIGVQVASIVVPRLGDTIAFYAENGIGLPSAAARRAARARLDADAGADDADDEEEAG